VVIVMDKNASSPNQPVRLSLKSPLVGAAFLMATSAIGPGFLTQTTVFTDQFRASFAFAILASIIVDIGVQLNIWRIVAMSKMRGQDIANAVLPGLGVFITILIVMGGLAFNIGNLAGTGLALEVLFGIPDKIGAAISCVLALILFSSKEIGKAMDRFAVWLGFLMIAIVLFIVFKTNPPWGQVVVKSVLPDNYMVLMLPMITLIGGVVGGYTSFSGAHRLLDAGIVGPENVKNVTNSATLGILIAGFMRTILFLAILGVVTQGVVLGKANPMADAFQSAAGQFGYYAFGVVLWTAAITSVVGNAYTSVSFLRSISKTADKYNSYTIMGFIIVSALVFIAVGRPIAILVIVGTLNGIILPIILTSILAAARNKKIVGADYHHPTWLIVFGVVAVLITAFAAAISLPNILSVWK
jgi:Mn2+/Fe2+ NRAMP family transporter